MRADNKGEGGSLALLALISRKAAAASAQVDARASSCSASSPARSSTAIQHDHAGHLGALGGRGPDHGRGGLRALRHSDRDRHPRRPVRASRRTARPGSAPCSARSCSSISSPSRCSASCTSPASPWIILETINPLNAFSFFLTDGWQRLPRAGLGRARRHRRRGALCRHGPFRPQADRRLLAVLRHAGPDAQLYGPGRDDPVARSGGRGTRRSRNPFFLLAPETLRLPLVILATLATIIASQAVISGAFSVTQQAMQLGFIPRLQHPAHQRGRAAARSTSR